MSNRKVLIVAYGFPPIGGISVQRPLKFVRYLGDSGWVPVVLTTANAHTATMDPSLLSEIPDGVHVERVEDPVAKLLSKAMGGQAAASGTSRPSTDTKPARGGWKSRVKAWLKSARDTLFLPDESVLWALRAVVQGCRLVRQQSIDCMYTTSGPHSTHLTGWLVKRLTGVTWVADFRDPWTDNMHYTRTGWQRRLELWLERKVFQQADRVITVTEGFQTLFASKYPEARGKIDVIRNGVDPADFPQVEPPSRNAQEPFTFFYAGILYPKRSPAPFFHALAKLVQQGQVTPQDVRADFAGVFDYPGKSDNRDLVRQLGIQDYVNVLGYMPRDEALRRMLTADGLLLIGENVPESKMYVPGKLYEYLYAERPILALLERGEAAQLIENAQAGAVFDATDMDGIAEEILRLIRVHREGGEFPVKREEVARHTRKSQSVQLAKLLASLV